jgi:predicted CoA-binding protein
MRWAGHVACLGKKRNSYRVLVVNPEGKRLLGRPRCRWEDNIKMHLKEIGCEDLDWVNMARDWDKWLAILQTVIDVWVP